jgi:hypothetical protein
VNQPAGRLPPIVLAPQVNLIQLQRQLKGLLKGNFEFSRARNGTRIVTKEMADFSIIRSHFESNNLPYFTFYPKSQKPIKAVIRHLPFTTPEEDISDGVVGLAFDVISVKQMSATRRSPAEGTSTVNFPFFLMTLPRTSKSIEIFKLTSLYHIAIRVEAYKAQTGLTQCYNCQKFGHVRAHCKQPPRCMWCGAGHLPGKGQCGIDIDMLKLQVTGRRGTSSLQLSSLQPRQGRDAEEKVAESVQDYN